MLSRIPTNTRVRKNMGSSKKKILFIIGVIFALVVLFGIYNLKKKVLSNNKSKIPIKIQSTDQPMSTKKSVKVNTGGGSLNIRADHSTTAKKIGEIPDGTIVEVQAETDGWYQVSYNGKTGWVSKQYVMLADVNSTGQTSSTGQTFQGNGYTFQYSKDWNVQNYPTTDSTVWVAISNNQLPADPPQGSYFIPIVLKTYPDNIKPSGGFRTDPATQQTPATVGGVSAIRYTYTNQDTSTQVNTVEFERNGVLYDFYDNGGYIDDLNKILGTFTFN